MSPHGNWSRSMADRSERSALSTGLPMRDGFPPRRWLEMRMMQPRGVALRHFDNQ
jgi:hypothetical protein